MTPRVYEPERARQLRILLWIVVVMAALMVAFAAFLLLLGGVDAGRVLLVLVLPGALMLGLGGWSQSLLARGQPAARLSVPATAAVSILVGLLFSRSGPGLLVSLVGILLFLIAVLPGRETDAGASR